MIQSKKRIDAIDIAVMVACVAVFFAYLWWIESQQVVIAIIALGLR